MIESSFTEYDTNIEMLDTMMFDHSDNIDLSESFSGAFDLLATDSHFNTLKYRTCVQPALETADQRLETKNIFLTCGPY